jgi:hypothetical protein
MHFSFLATTFLLAVLPNTSGPALVPPAHHAPAAPAAQSERTARTAEAFAAPLRSEAQRAVELRARTSSLLASAGRRASVLPASAIELSVADSFAQWFEQAWSYQSAYFEYTNQQAIDLANALQPSFESAQAARSALLESMGGTYELTTTWLWSVPNGSSYLKAQSSDGATATISSLVLLPWSFAELDLTAEPDFVQAALAAGNDPQNAAYFYSASFDGTIQHTGVAAPVVVSGATNIVL